MYSRVKGVYGVNATVNELNEVLFRLHVPALIFVAVCIAVGVVGNIIVLLVYKTKFRRSNHRYFILFLAALDFFACVTGMPFLIASLRLPYLMTSSTLCKYVRYVHYLVNNSSGLLLLVISAERYRKICRPFKTQLTSKQTLCLCYGTIFFSAVIAVPAYVVYGASTIYTGVGNVTGYQCYIDDTLKEPLHFEIYQGLLLIETVLCVVIFIIMYAFIIRKLWTSDQFIQAMRSMQLKSNKSTQEASFSTDVDEEDNCSSISSLPKIQMTEDKQSEESLMHKDKPACTTNATESESQICELGVSCQTINKTQSLWPIARELINVKGNCNGKIELTRASSDITLNRVNNPTRFRTLTPTGRMAIGHLLKSKHQQSAEPTKARSRRGTRTTARVTLMLFTVSLLFVISFIPHLVLMIVATENRAFLDNLTETEYMLYQVFLRSFILNNVVNPVIYIFCDTKFRRMCKEFFLRNFKCKQN